MDSALASIPLVFLLGTFAGALVAGLAGFAFGLVAAAIWLHALTPAQATPLIVAYALLVQGYAVWKLRHALQAARLIPLIAGSAVGIPVGIALLQWASAAQLRSVVGGLLVAFSLYNLMRPKLPQMAFGRIADGAVGVLNGVVGGATGLGGILPTIWCGLRGWPRDEQRAVFQPTAVATFLITLLWLGGAGGIGPETAYRFVIGLPPLVAGTWLGWRLYGHLDEAGFRKVVLGLLLVSGLVLLFAGQ